MKATKLRILSSSSVTSIESVATLSGGGKAIEDLFPVTTDVDYVYESALKVLVLEYINEPRFRRRWKKIPDPNLESGERVSGTRRTNRDQSHHRLSTWFNSSEEDTQSSQHTIQVILPKLEERLSFIALNQVKVSDPVLRRSLLKFYNDVFLDPQFTQFVKTISKSEDLLMLFIKSANNEITKMDVVDPKKQLFNQVNYFINMLIHLSSGTSKHEEFAGKLRSYRDSFEAKALTSGPRNHRTELSDQVKRIDVTLQPSFRFNEVSHAKVLCTLFGVDELKVQQDIVSMSSIVKNDLYEEEMEKQRSLLNNDQGIRIPSHFLNIDEYSEWKNWLLKNIKENCDKMQEGAAGHNQSQERSKTSGIIPDKASEVLMTLCIRVLENEFNENLNSFSADARFLISKCAKYWLLDYSSSFACIIVSSMAHFMNGKIEKGNSDCVVPLIKFIFSYVEAKIFTNPSEMNATGWNQVDKVQWYTNLHEIFVGCIKCLQMRMKMLFIEPKPKFLSITAALSSVVELDPLMISLDFVSSDSYRKGIKKLRKQLFKTSEIHYIELVKKIPTNREIQMCHLYELSENILNDIQQIQERYSKPLLNYLYIPKEVSIVLIGAIFADLALIIERIEKYNNSPVPDAIDAYRSLAELRNVYRQVKGEPMLNLEGYFIKYLEEFCDETGLRITEGIQNAFLKESWEPVDLTKTKLYSISVVDIFKMINESLKMFESLSWANKIQICEINTRIFKSFSDGILIYVDKLMLTIEKDLAALQEEWNDVQEENTEERQDLGKIHSQEQEKMTKAWFFVEMKNVLKSKSTMELPKPFLFKKRTCICLNNLNSMLELFDTLEERFNTKEISEILQKQAIEKKKPIESLMEIYTLRVIGAEDILLPERSAEGTSTSISFLDTRSRHEVYRTKDVTDSSRPMWNEEFQLHLRPGHKNTINLMVWHHPNKKKSALNQIRNIASKSSDSHKMYGKCYLDLHSKLYSTNGKFKNLVLELDTPGRINLQISLELDKNDASFAVARAKRSLSRAIERGIHLIAEKFTPFIHYAISTQTLFSICPRASSVQPSDDVIYDSILPLFDYLNSNLAVLATDLSHGLLIKTMLEIWLIILNQADDLLLPQLLQTSTDKKPLSSLQIQIVFQWLNALCIDFFHNNGQGPSLEELKNKHYHRLLLIPHYYDFTTEQLMDIIFSYNSDAENDCEARTDLLTTENQTDICLRILMSRGKTSFVRSHIQRRRNKARDYIARRAIFKHNHVIPSPPPSSTS